MSDLADLYQEMVTDHARNPRHRGTLDPYDHSADGHNPLCGDRIHLTLTMDGDRIADVAFDGEGCAISTASTDLMADAVRGRSLEEVRALFESFQTMVTCEDAPDDLGKLATFAGVREFPMRVKCATLAWHTLMAALKAGGGTVTTE